MELFSVEGTELENKYTNTMYIQTYTYTNDESTSSTDQDNNQPTITITIPREKLPPTLTEIEDTVTITLPQNAIHPYLRDGESQNINNEQSSSSANNVSKNLKRGKDLPPTSDRFKRSSTSQADN